MTSILGKVYTILDPRSRRLVPVAVVLSGGLAALEALGVSLFLPLISSALDRNGEQGPNYSVLGDVLQFLKIAPSGGEVSAATLAALIISTLLIKNILGVVIIRWISRFGLTIKADLAERLLSRYLAAPFSWHLRQSSAAVIKNLEASSQAVTAIIIPTLNILADLLLLVFLSGVLLVANFWIALFAGTLLCGVALINHRVTRNMAKRSGTDSLITYARMIQNVQECIGAIREVKLLKRNKDLQILFRRNFDMMMDAQFVRIMLSQLPRYVFEIVFLIAIAVFAAVGFGNASPDDVVPVIGLFAVASLRLLPAINRIVIVVQNIRTALPALNVVYEDFTNPALTMEPPDKVELMDWNSVQFENVSFAYEGRAKTILSNINFRISKGQKVGLVGWSGAGKSTVIDLLAVLVEPSSGDIYLDGRRLSDVRQQWQCLLGYVPQQVFLLEGSIRSNITFTEEISQSIDERLNIVAEATGLRDLIEQLPEGLDTNVGERGSSLSGGQAQRIGIARALYNDPSVILFDEATSALDNETEAEIYRRVFEKFQGRTFIVSAHRLSTMQQMDHIFYFRDGTLAGEGDFTELYEKNQDFQRLVRLGSAQTV